MKLTDLCDDILFKIEDEIKIIKDNKKYKFVRTKLVILVQLKPPLNTCVRRGLGWRGIFLPAQFPIEK